MDKVQYNTVENEGGIRGPLGDNGAGVDKVQYNMVEDEGGIRGQWGWSG